MGSSFLGLKSMIYFFPTNFFKYFLLREDRIRVEMLTISGKNDWVEEFALHDLNDVFIRRIIFKG